MPKQLPLPPVSYTVYKRLLGRYNDLYSMWQGQLDEIADLKKENALLWQQLYGLQSLPVAGNSSAFAAMRMGIERSWH